MSQFEPRVNNSPFKVDLCCNINIEVHVAMRLGELIRSSKTEDKQLMALGHRLSYAMTHLVDQLDNRQWDRLSSYMEEQSQDDSYGNSDENSYVSKARKSFPESSEYKNDFQHRAPSDMRNFVSSVVSRKE